MNKKRKQISLKYGVCSWANNNKNLISLYHVNMLKERETH